MQNFLKNRSGNVGIAFALLAMPIVAAVSLSVDLGNLARTKSHAQQSLDAAALQAAIAAEAGASDEAILAKVNAVFNAEMELSDTSVAPGTYTALYGGVVAPVDGSRTYSFSATVPHTRYFKVGSAAGNTVAVATGIRKTPGDPVCLFALDPSAGRALKMSGSGILTATKCVVGAFSNAADAVYVGGASAVNVECVRSSGGIDATNGLTTTCAKNATNAGVTADPFAKIPEPTALAGSVTTCTSGNGKGKKSGGGTTCAAANTYTPGSYYNLSLKDTNKLEPGVYVIEGGLDIKGSVIGDGVTIFMKSGGITINGNADVTLTSPKSGDYSGILFMGADTNSSMQKFNGTGTMDLDGFMYFPSSEVQINGNSTTSATCLRVIAKTIDISGNSNVEFSCDTELGGRIYTVGGGYHYVK
jgi:Flp pilus assembly protein TadG